jgi:glycosyltransferase involved in cell wall biosynthesis
MQLKKRKSLRLENDELSIVIPVWNEEKWINRCYVKVRDHLTKNNITANLIFASDGCTDATPDIIAKIAENSKMVYHINDSDKLGRGGALKRIFEMIQTKYIIYVDTDLATDLDYLISLINGLKEGNDIVTGSRLLPDSNCVRDTRRSIASRVYNFLVRSLFRSKIHDHQCGFKAFSYSTTHELILDIKDDDWFWDTEVLIRAQRENLKIKEIPVKWEDRSRDDSKVSVLSDARTMGYSLLKLRWELSPLTFKQFTKFAIVGISNTFISYFILLLLEILNIRGNWGYPVAYIFGLVNSFIWNRRYSFSIVDGDNVMTDFLKFFMANLIGLSTYTIAGIYAENSFHASIFWANIIGILCSVVVQFLLYKFYVFNRGS